ncbi:MAG: hypothetical protein LC799_31945 [Actinobacteria bacterium]|nr:hypothetical protein [Actinomycetota bacterium]
MNQLASSYQVSRAVIDRWLRELGTEPRKQTEANRTHLAQLSREQRAAKVSAAHAALRGRPKTPEVKARVAQGRQRNRYGGRPSPRQQWLAGELAERGHDVVEELAIGPYNLDIAIPEHAVAVEILGGTWHAGKAIHCVRSPHILDAGWHLVLIWDLPGHDIPVGPGAVDYLVAFLESTSLYPSAPGEYRVIRGDGQLCTASRPDDDDFTLKSPSVRKVH